MADNDYQAIYYRRADGTQPVEIYIDEEIPAKQQPAILRQVDRLNTLNDAMPHLPYPHSSQIDGELRELRRGPASGYRCCKVGMGGLQGEDGRISSHPTPRRGTRRPVAHNACRAHSDAC